MSWPVGGWHRYELRWTAAAAAESPLQLRVMPADAPCFEVPINQALPQMHTPQRGESDGSQRPCVDHSEMVVNDGPEATAANVDALLASRLSAGQTAALTAGLGMSTQELIAGPLKIRRASRQACASRRSQPSRRQCNMRKRPWTSELPIWQRLSRASRRQQPRILSTGSPNLRTRDQGALTE